MSDGKVSMFTLNYVLNTALNQSAFRKNLISHLTMIVESKSHNIIQHTKMNILLHFLLIQRFSRKDNYVENIH